MLLISKDIYSAYRLCVCSSFSCYWLIPLFLYIYIYTLRVCKPISHWWTEQKNLHKHKERWTLPGAVIRVCFQCVWKAKGRRSLEILYIRSVCVLNGILSMNIWICEHIYLQILNMIFETQFYNSSKNSFEQIKSKKNCFKRLSLVETLYYSIEYCSSFLY